MITREAFQRFYNSELQPLLAQTETERKSVASANTIHIIALVVLGVIAISVFAAGGEAAVIIPIVIGIGVVWWYKTKKQAFSNNFKQTIITRIIKFISPVSVYEPQSIVSESEYRNSGLYQKDYDKYDGEDYFEGVHEKTSFFCSELHTQYKTTDSKGHTSWHNIFEGLFFVADFNKNFSGRTYVWQNNGGEASNTFIGKLFSSFSRSVERVHLESPEFESTFDAYGTDQIEARYILSPSLMERLLHVQQRMNCCLCCSFIDSKLYMAFETDIDLFEPGILNSNESMDVAWSYVLQFNLFFDIITELNLNTRIWTKG